MSAGLFGSIILSMLLIPMYFIHGLKPFTSDSEHLEDVWDALAQIQNNSHIALAITGFKTILSFKIRRIIISYDDYRLTFLSIQLDATDCSAQLSVHCHSSMTDLCMLLRLREWV